MRSCKFSCSTFTCFLSYTATKGATDVHCDSLCSSKNAPNYHCSIAAIELVLSDQTEMAILCWRGPVVSAAECHPTSWTVAEATLASCMKSVCVVTCCEVTEVYWVLFWQDMENTGNMHHKQKSLRKLTLYLLRRSMVSRHLVWTARQLICSPQVPLSQRGTFYPHFLPGQVSNTTC